MLNKNFYQVTNTQETDGGIVLTIQFNAQHKIFEGHFPNQPVVPGVCTLQIIKEQLSQQLQQPIVLREAAQVKYLNTITPAQAPIVNFTILYHVHETNISVTATITDGAVTYCKARLVFTTNV